VPADDGADGLNVGHLRQQNLLAIAAGHRRQLLATRTQYAAGTVEFHSALNADPVGADHDQFVGDRSRSE
jgi:hypothetical protein